MARLGRSRPIRTLVRPIPSVIFVGTPDTVPPGNINVTSVTAAKISSVSGKDSTDVSFTADEAFIEYKIKRVSSIIDTHLMGSLIEQATVSTRTSHTVTVSDDELIAASGSEGPNLVKVFVKDAAGNWSGNEFLTQEMVWPVFDTSVLGSSYAPVIPLTTPSAIRYIDADTGNDSNNGESWGTAWKSAYNAFQSIPAGGGVRTWIRGFHDFTDPDQYFPSPGQLVIGNTVDGISSAPNELICADGDTATIAKGWVTLRQANYYRIAGVTFDGMDLATDQLLKIEQSSNHVEISYCKMTRARDQGLLVENTCADIHSLCNWYSLNGNGVHPNETPGFFDHDIYVKNVPRFLSINDVFEKHSGGYSVHAYDSTGDNPIPGGRILHPTIVGNPGAASSGWIIDDGDDIIFANFISVDHQEMAPDTSQSGYAGRWVNASTGGEARVGLINGNDEGSLVDDAIQTIPAAVTTTDVLTEDPEFADKESSNYQLLPSSPAKSTGEPWGVLVDHYGRERSATDPSRGAVE